MSNKNTPDWRTYCLTFQAVLKIIEVPRKTVWQSKSAQI